MYRNLDSEQFCEFKQVLADVTSLRISPCIAFQRIREIVKHKPALWKNFRKAYELCRTRFETYRLDQATECWHAKGV
jgi:hypothetical protein